MLATRMRQPAMTSLVENLSDEKGNDGTVALGNAQNLAEEIELALQTLRTEYRQAFVLFHQRELSYAQISVTLGLPVGHGQNLGTSRAARSSNI